MNRFTAIIILFVSLISGQKYYDMRNTDFTFKEAINRYNRSEYLETKYILSNLPYSEKEYYKEDVQLLLMRTEYQLNNFSESMTLGKTFLREYPNSDYLADAFMIFGDIYLSENNIESAFRTYLKALKENDERKYNDKIVKRIFRTLQFGINETVVNELLSFELDDNIIQILLLSKAHIEIQNGKFILAQETLEKIDTNELYRVSNDYYKQLIKEAQQDFRNVIVPVVLPLSGKYSKIGTEFLEGLKFAQSNSFQKTLNLTLILYDNESDQLKTLSIFDKIYKNNNVSAVLGPINLDNAIIACSFSHQLGLPIILPNATANGLADISENVFLLNSDLKTRGQLAAKYIAGELQGQNIAVLAPVNNAGKDIVDAFQNELKNYGLSVAILEWYAGIPTSLDRQFKAIRTKAWEIADLVKSAKLVDTTFTFDGTYFDDSMYDYDSTFAVDSLFSYSSVIDSMLAIFKSEENVMTKKDSAKVILESVDAIYMPINQGDLDYIGAQFPAYNLKTTVVGNDNWTDLNILQKENIGPHLKGLIAISNYAYYNINLLNQAIDQKHTEYFYQAIDAYNLMVEAVSKSLSSGKSIQSILHEIDNFEGIFGTYNFTNGKNSNSKLNVVKFDGHRFDKLEILNNQYIY